MTDIVNQRVDEAQMELQLRAQRLEKLVKRAKGKNMPPAFQEMAQLTMKMIDNEVKLYDEMIFSAPKTELEQMRNLMLLTGKMNQTVKEGIKPATDAIDTMIQTLESMSHGAWRRLRGNRDDLTARCLSNLLVFEPATFVAGREPWPQTKNKNATGAF